MIKIKRDSGYADLFRAYKVVLDGKAAAQIKNGQEIELEAPPGKHQLYLKLDWCRSNIVEFESGGGELKFECGSNLRDWKIFLAVVYAAIYPKEYMWLKRILNPPIRT